MLQPPEEKLHTRHGTTSEDDLLLSLERQAHKKELIYGELENRLRVLVTDLISPTVHKASTQQSDLDEVRTMVINQSSKIEELSKMNTKLIKTTTSLEAIQDEFTRLDTKMAQVVVSANEDIKTLRVDVQGAQKHIELKDSAILQMQRNLDRCSIELNRISRSSMDAAGGEPNTQLQISDMRKTAHKQICDLEAKIMGVQIQQTALTDQLWGDETGMAQIAGEVKKTREGLEEVINTVRTLQSSRVEPEHLAQLRAEMQTYMGKAQEEVRSLRTNVGNVVNDTKEHLRTALETVATQYAGFIEEVRSSYKNEMGQAAVLRKQFESHFSEMKKDEEQLFTHRSEAANKTEDRLLEAEYVLKDSERRRKKDRTSVDIELKSIQKRLGGMFDNHKMISEGFDHIASIVQILLESMRMQCAFNMQDTLDREHMYLMGLKEESSLKEPISSGSPRKAKVIYGSPSRARKLQQIAHVDPRCLSCSGQASSVLSAFKIACLQYNPSPVRFRGTDYSRIDLLSKMGEMVSNGSDMYTSGPAEAVRRDSEALASTRTSSVSHHRSLEQYMPLTSESGMYQEPHSARESRLVSSTLPRLGKSDMIE